jgi:hypothetical protein
MGAQSGLLPHPGRRGGVVNMVNVTVTAIEAGDRYGHHEPAPQPEGASARITSASSNQVGGLDRLED